MFLALQTEEPSKQLNSTLHAKTHTTHTHTNYMIACKTNPIPQQQTWKQTSTFTSCLTNEQQYKKTTTTTEWFIL